MGKFRSLRENWVSKFNSVFVKYFMIHIILFSTIILGTNIFIYNQSVATIKKNQHDAEIDLLHQYRNMLTLIFREVEEVIEQSANDSNTLNFILQPLPLGEDTGVIRSLQDDLRNLASSNQNIVSAYVYSVDNEQIVASNQQSYEAEDFYDREWLPFYNENLVGTHMMETRKMTDGYGNEFNVITFIRNLPYKSFDQRGAFVVNVNVDRLYKRLAGANKDSNGLFYVINSSGNILLHPNQQMLNKNIREESISMSTFKNKSDYFVKKSEEGDQLYTYITSMTNNWKYIYEISIDELNSQLDTIKGLMISSILVALLLALGLAYMVTKYVSNPLQKLLSIIPGYSREKYSKQRYRNEYEYLDNVYHSLAFDNKNMQNVISDIKPVMKEKLLNVLVTGKKITHKEVNEKLSLLNIDFTGHHYLVLAIQIDDYEAFYRKRSEVESSLHKASLANMVEQLGSQEFACLCGEVESDKLAVILNYRDDLPVAHLNEKMAQLVHDLQEKVNEGYPFTVTIGIGRSYRELLDIRKSYRDSLRALKYKFYLGKDRVILVDDIDLEEDELYYYNNGRIKLLMNQLKIGDQPGVKRELQLLFEEVESEKMNYEYSHQLFQHLISSVVEFMISSSLDMKKLFGANYNIYEEYSSKQTLHDIQEFFANILEAVAGEVARMNGDKLPKTAEKILEYIDEHFHTDISLNDVADWVGMSTTYVSKIIKEATGKSYLDYVNGKRVDRAKQLLASTQLTSKEIGFKIGFNNIQTFMRVFKKYEGITPGQYREKA
jgi:two-component system, response regulator YesN